MNGVVRAVPGEYICNWHEAALTITLASVAKSSHFGELTSSRKSITQTRWTGFAHPRQGIWDSSLAIHITQSHTALFWQPVYPVYPQVNAALKIILCIILDNSTYFIKNWGRWSRPFKDLSSPSIRSLSVKSSTLASSKLMFTGRLKAAASDRSLVKSVHHMRFRSRRSDVLKSEFLALE